MGVKEMKRVKEVKGLRGLKGYTQRAVASSSRVSLESVACWTTCPPEGRSRASTWGTIATEW